MIDLNADLGEGFGHDEALLDLVTSANVACGGHAGDEMTMVATCAAAVERGVVIGAHPSYPDRQAFGRHAMDLSLADLGASLAGQFAALARAAGATGATVGYVKPHGALYHRVAIDPEIAEVVVEGALIVDGVRPAAGPLLMLGQPHGASPWPKVQHVVEGFVDRGYTLDAAGHPTLVDRLLPGALLSHDDAVVQAVALATTGIATALDGRPVAVHPRSLCLHGDSPGAVALAREIRAELLAAGIAVKAFA